MSGKVKCSCGHSWNKSDSSSKDMNVCHICGKDNTMKDGGWLDKYNDGGPVQPNYNDYSVSAPKGFQGDGYSNVGRNYSPAWGGQFAMGGSLPGAVGFTYARTNSPAPSNGPYAKKTKASAQDGANVETVYSGMLPEITVVGSKDPQTEEFYRNMMDRLTKEEGSNYGIMKNNDIYSDPNPETLNMVFDNPISSGNILGRYQGLMDLGKKYGFPKVHPKDPNSIFAVASKLSDTELESGPRPNYNPFTKTIQASTSKNWLDEMAHHVQFKNNPISTGVKFLTNDVPAYISGKSPYTTSGTMEHEAHSIIEPKLEEEIEASKRNYRQLPYIQKLTEQFYGPIENYQNGGEMRYYQEGLDFRPKTISKNGSVIKDDMGQWAHPGEITEIGSNQITMQGVPYPVLGISDTGDTQMMYPNQEYQYDGSSVTEYPMAQDGITTPPTDLYYGPRSMKFCKGKGCAEIATTGVANLLGVDRESLSPQDAWYKRAAVLKNKGKEVWNKKSKDYSGVQVGDFVSLDRTGNWHTSDESQVPGYTLKDNEGNEHVGFVVGRDPKTGKHLVEHGSESGNVYVQPIDELSLPDVGFEYSPTSIYRSASTEGKKPVNPRFYTKPGSGVPVKWASKTAKPTENDKRYIAAINANSGKQQMMLGLNPTETKYLNDLSYGIFHNETEGGESKTPIGGSMIAASMAHEFGKLLPSFINRRPTSASLSDVQFKYDDELMNADGTISKVGKYMNDLGVDREGLYSTLNHRADYNDEVNAVASKLANDYQKIKKNPKKYQYNAETNTVYGDIPVSHALLAAYNLGPSALNSPKKIKGKQNYINNAYKHIMNLNTELMGTLPEVTVTAKKTKKSMEQGGQLTKLDQLTNFTNYNTKQPGGWLSKYE